MRIAIIKVSNARFLHASNDSTKSLALKRTFSIRKQGRPRCVYISSSQRLIRSPGGAIQVCAAPNSRVLRRLGLKTDMVFKGTAVVYQRIHCFNSNE